MANTYTWTISNLTTLPTQNGQYDVVVLANYVYSGSDGTNNVEFVGNEAFNYNGGAFTPFDKLTQEVVVGWVQDSLTEKVLLLMKNSMDKQLEVATLTSVSPSEQQLPWTTVAQG
jgi:hypothetical protein